MTCHHIPSVRCPECADNRPSMGYWPTPCGTCAALREENVRLRQRVEELEWQQQGLILERDQLLDIQKESEAKLARVVEAGELLLAAYGEAHALYNLGECEGSVKMRAALSGSSELQAEARAMLDSEREK